MIHSAYMLKAMCRITVGLCRNAPVRKRHGSDPRVTGTKAMSSVVTGHELPEEDRSAEADDR
jgi:hypothetical protein